MQALILHYINKGLKNQGCYGKQIGVVEASRYSANTLALPSLSIFLLHYVFHLPAKRYYTSAASKVISSSSASARITEKVLYIGIIVGFFFIKLLYKRILERILRGISSLKSANSQMIAIKSELQMNSQDKRFMEQEGNPNEFHL